MEARQFILYMSVYALHLKHLLLPEILAAVAANVKTGTNSTIIIMLLVTNPRGPRQPHRKPIKINLAILNFLKKVAQTQTHHMKARQAQVVPMTRPQGILSKSEMKAGKESQTRLKK